MSNCHTDIDECNEGNHKCEQVCENSIGSYQCSCFDGYMLHGNFSCQGKLFYIAKNYDITYDGSITMSSN